MKNNLSATHRLPGSAALVGAALFSFLSFSPTGSAQDVIAAGFAQTASQPNPVAFAQYASLSTGDRVVFDGLTVELYDGTGQLLGILGNLPSFVYASFVELDPTESYALVGESSNGDIFRVPLDGSGMSLLTNLFLNYDADFEDAQHVIVSHSSCGAGCPNNLVRVNVNTGAGTLVATVPGPSGPVAVAPNGDLYYGTVHPSFPPPPRSSDILYWSTAQTHGSLPLTEQDATTCCRDLNSAVSLAIDPVFGNVFIAESIWGRPSRIHEIGKESGDKIETVVTSANWIANLELIQGGSPGHFHAWQPADGVFLHYDNGNIITVAPQRPTSTITQIGSTVTFSVQGAKPNGAMLVLWGPQSSYNALEESYQLAFEFLFHTGIPLNELRRLPFMLPIDSNGTGSFVYFDPGNLAGTLVFQALITDHAGRFLGSSEASLN